jgi:hypothetical protein
MVFRMKWLARLCVRRQQCTVPLSIQGLSLAVGLSSPVVAVELVSKESSLQGTYHSGTR